LLPQCDEMIEENSCDHPISYYLAGDDAFPLEENIMKPYSQRKLTEEKRIFNYRLSRGRRISENVFGILSSRFRVFMSVLCVKPESAVSIVLASIALHNFLRSKAADRYIPSGSIDADNRNGNVVEGSWRQEIKESQPFSSYQNPHKGRQPRKAEAMRDELCQYFNGRGQVPWQWNILL